ncbi:tetratricopeptide (TPR) repeat protein [Saccharothrix coeruleofusca]|uniref:FxSxx-COOH system tetratricopeptide repeat protein n=1 Tax=Saccharothrix coeruleofusca TaxID=33919 RepID=UPI001AEB5037|nr:FxSxx-COOH system tetratricopeptide repeat protein [Saccharothrix coeruleofusca]MBP2339794.1 tetratricopeptide (TPR) repeat protein [Saccharothrix coeruleofusca]
MASRQVKINAVVVVLVGAAVGVVTNYASDEIPEWFKDQTRVWLVFGVLVLLAVVVQLVASRERPERSMAIGRGNGRTEVWNVPGRNPNFTGRDSDLRELRRLLRARSRVAVHAVRGMGGVGKTQLVLEYCHRHGTRLEVVWWIAAEEPTLIPEQLRGLGRALDLELPQDANDAAQVVVSHLRGLRRWLLVFDNAESVADLHPFLPSGAGRVLVTTRRAGFDTIGGVLDLDTMPRRESLALLARRAPGLTGAQADELADLLGDLPLGLEQAAAYLAKSRMPAHEYLHLLRTTPDGLADKGEDGQRRTPDRSLNTLWTLSLRRLDQYHPAAAQLLAVCAYLAPDAIPLDLFTANSTALPDPLNAEAATPEGLSHVIGVLTDYSLVKRDHQTITVHRLVQLAVRRHTTATSSKGEHEQHSLAWVITLLHADLPGDVYRNPQAWPRWRRLLPHVLAALNHHPEIPGPAPASASWLLDRTGTYLQSTGQFSQARPLLERALAIGEAAHGPDHPAVATRLSNLALVLRDLGRPAEARPLLERALAIDEAVHGPDHPDVATSLGNLALVLRDLGRPAEARPLLERALAIDEAVHGPDHPAVATRLSNLALVLRDLGRPAEARPLLERALAIDEAVHGPDHPDVATSLSNLATVLRNLGRPAEARPLLERALAIDEAVHGPDHPAVATSLSNLATVLRNLGRPAEARPLLERALAIDEAVHGPDHPDVATSLSNLATVLQDLGRPAEARPLLERALAIGEAVHGPDHPAVAIRLGNLALVLRDLGRSAEARPLLERALAIGEAVHGPDHPDVAIRLGNLALVLRDLGRPAEAQPLLERAEKIRSSR